MTLKSMSMIGFLGVLPKFINRNFFWLGFIEFSFKYIQSSYHIILYLLQYFRSLLQLYIRKMTHTAQKLKFSIQGFFSKCDQNRSILRIWSHLLKKFLMENFNFVQWQMFTLSIKRKASLLSKLNNNGITNHFINNFCSPPMIW